MAVSESPPHNVRNCSSDSSGLGKQYPKKKHRHYHREDVDVDDETDENEGHSEDDASINIGIDGERLKLSMRRGLGHRLKCILSGLIGKDFDICVKHSGNDVDDNDDNSEAYDFDDHEDGYCDYNKLSVNPLFQRGLGHRLKCALLGLLGKDLEDCEKKAEDGDDSKDDNDNDNESPENLEPVDRLTCAEAVAEADLMFAVCTTGMDG
ncbi:hypothetical protein MMC28_000484 [Mycoblastus sanguinarius]|nr:hypothetical protein [Mycoblastus sanguinarius]